MLRAVAPRSLPLALLALGTLAASAGAAPAVDRGATATPVETNTKIAAGPEGNIWVDLAGPVRISG